MNVASYLSINDQLQFSRAMYEHNQKILADHGITPPYWAMLNIILHTKYGMRQNEIAQAMMVKPPLITVMAQNLSKKGYVQIVTHQFDSRAKLLALTPEGKKIVKLIEKELNRGLKTLVAGLEETDLAAYSLVLKTITKNAQQDNLTT